MRRCQDFCKGRCPPWCPGREHDARLDFSSFGFTTQQATKYIARAIGFLLGFGVPAAISLWALLR